MASFAQTARDLGFDLSIHQIEAFDTYRERLLEAAGEFNLTAVRDREGIERRHFIESLALGRALVDASVAPEDGNMRAVDVGSGAGFPGLPLKIAWPRLQLVLLESNHKRCQFLESMLAKIDASEAVVLEGRAEVWARDPEHRGAYDLVLARAVAPLNLLLEYTMPFLRIGGHLAAPKGSAAASEIVGAGSALTELGGEVCSRSFVPPGGTPQTLVIVTKVSETLDRYPRRPGIAKKRPLRS